MFLRTGRGHRYTLRAHHTKAHSRIIWSGAFTPDGASVVTASRDKLVKVWQTEQLADAGLGAGTVRPAASLDLGDSVTAVDVAPLALPDGYASVLPTFHQHF